MPKEPPTAGTVLTTVCQPDTYSASQIKQALAFAEALAPNPLLLAVAPPHDCADALDEHQVCVLCHRLYQD